MPIWESTENDSTTLKRQIMENHQNLEIVGRSVDFWCRMTV